MPVPAQPKIYHIVHVDRLASIVADGCLWSDAVMVQRQGAGTDDRHEQHQAAAAWPSGELPSRTDVSAITFRSTFVHARSCCT